MQRRDFIASTVATLGALALTSDALNATQKEPKMRFQVRKSSDRGRGNHGWLDSRHTFSFADYHDPKFMGFRSLRVINEDRVVAGAGFPTHPHRDMEIFSYVLAGALEHKDSMGNGRVLAPGEIQLMSAGRGVTHSEFNPKRDAALHFLQIWIVPDQRGLTPGYTEWKPDAKLIDAPKVLVISKDGREGGAVIHQDVAVYRVRLAAGERVEHELAAGRGAWLQVMRGKLAVEGTVLDAGDGARTEEAGQFAIVASEAAEALLFDLA